MKSIGACFALVMMGGLLTAGQQQPEQTPPGVHQAMQVPPPAQVTPPVFQPNPARRRVDPARMKQEAEELAKLAQQVPSEVDGANAGRLPKDLSEQLKKIEKLSKNLRHELSP